MGIVTVAGNSIDLSQISYISKVYVDHSRPTSSVCFDVYLKNTLRIINDYYPTEDITGSVETYDELTIKVEKIKNTVVEKWFNYLRN